MKVISVAVPDEIEDMAPYLQSFAQGMVTKLHRNAHKKPPRRCDALKFLLDLHQEMVELHRQFVEDPSHPNLFLEMHDVANFAFLMALAVQQEWEDRESKPETTEWLRTLANAWSVLNGNRPPVLPAAPDHVTPPPLVCYDDRLP